MQYFQCAEPCYRYQKVQKIHHAQPDGTNRYSAQRVCTESEECTTQIEVSQIDQNLLPDRNETDQGDHHSDIMFVDLINLMENVHSDTLLRDLRNDEVSGGLEDMLGEQNVPPSTYSSAGQSTFLSSEPMRYTEAPGYSASPPRRFYRTFWRAMARKALIRLEATLSTE
jgi:hypothetical protein